MVIKALNGYILHSSTVAHMFLFTLLHSVFKDYTHSVVVHYFDLHIYTIICNLILLPLRNFDNIHV